MRFQRSPFLIRRKATSNIVRVGFFIGFFSLFCASLDSIYLKKNTIPSAKVSALLIAAAKKQEPANVATSANNVATSLMPTPAPRQEFSADFLAARRALSALQLSAHDLALKKALGEGPFAQAFFETLTASEHVKHLAGKETALHALSDGYRPLFLNQAAELLLYAKKALKNEHWDGLDRERYLVAASVAALPELAAEGRQLLVDCLSEKILAPRPPASFGQHGQIEQSGQHEFYEAFGTGYALLSAHFGNEQDAFEHTLRILSIQHDTVLRARLASLLEPLYPDAAQKLRAEFKIAFTVQAENSTAL